MITPIFSLKHAQKYKFKNRVKREKLCPLIILNFLKYVETEFLKPQLLLNKGVIPIEHSLVQVPACKFILHYIES